MKAHPELAAIRLPDKERIDHLPEIIEELAKRVDVLSNETSNSAKTAATKHGKETSPPGLYHSADCD